MSFKDFKRNRENLNSKLQASLEKTEGASYEKDNESFWKLTVDKKTGIGEAIIRFLPEAEGNDLPYVKLFNHGFKSSLTGKWYIENSLTTPTAEHPKGQLDPLGEINRELWATGVEANKNIVRQRKRKLSYYANILVIKDKANPDNEGKVFKFRFGQKIFDMIEAQRNPSYDDVEKVVVWDFWEGANFRLRSKKIMVDGKDMPSYEDSEFDRPTALFKGDDVKLEEVWKSLYDLREVIAQDKFKSFDELKAKLRDVLGAEANNYTLFGGSAGNAKAGIHADAPSEAAPVQRTARAADLPVDGGEEDVPWATDDAKGEAAQSADAYFGDLGNGKSFFND